MNDRSIYQLSRVPIRRLAHNAVQRQVILTSTIIKNKSDFKIEETKKSIEELRESVTIQMLPLYIHSNFSLTESWGQYTELFSGPVISNVLIMRWQWAFHFLKTHPEVEKAALVYPIVKLCANPFNHLDPSKLYVGDEVVDLQNAGFFSQDLSLIEQFWQLNPRLQLLNPGVIVGCRTPLLEIISAMLVFIKENLTDEMQINFNVHNEQEIFNYLMYQYFAQRMVHGRKVTTIYGFEQQTSRSWYKYR